jgi:hypothetical protein
MLSMTDTIEDIISSITAVNLSESDRPILLSLARQLGRNIGLTDRQYDLAKQKIRSYKDELELLGFDEIEKSLATLKIPLRQIDRTKTIQIVDSAFDDVLMLKKAKAAKWIKIRFPFNKKTMQAIEELVKAHRHEYHHPHSSHTHYFALNEPIVENVVSKFRDRNFVIDQALLDAADEIAAISKNKEAYVPGLYNDVLKNLRPNAVEFIASEVDDSDPHRALKLCDRRRRYGLDHVDVDVQAGLLGEIAHRDSTEVKLNLELHPINELADVINTLDRFPLLVLIDEKTALEEVKSVHEAFAGVDNSKQAALFRVTSSGSPTVNDYIKDHKLNNWVDKNTKIVYISKNKLPKVLLNSKWQPMCVLDYVNSRRSTHVTTFVRNSSDLTIYLRDEPKKW